MTHVSIEVFFFSEALHLRLLCLSQILIWGAKFIVSSNAQSHGLGI